MFAKLNVSQTAFNQVLQQVQLGDLIQSNIMQESLKLNVNAASKKLYQPLSIGKNSATPSS